MEYVRVDRSHSGQGVFACRAFRRNQRVAEVRGEVIEEEGYESDYCIDLGETVMEPLAPFRFLNHSCEPNCELIVEEDDSCSPPSQTVYLYAIRTIRESDELTIDYGWLSGERMRCLCGSRKCRGWIGVEDDLRASAT